MKKPLIHCMICIHSADVSFLDSNRKVDRAVIVTNAKSDRHEKGDVFESRL
jgi:hypothetical protein